MSNKINEEQRNQIIKLLSKNISMKQIARETSTTEYFVKMVKNEGVRKSLYQKETLKEWDTECAKFRRAYERSKSRKE